MAEYIEREAFIEILNRTKNDCKHYADKMCCDFAIRMANLMPPADVQEVRHGKWDEELYDIICSACKESFNIISNDVHRFDFCPNCGAKMDKE